MKHKLLNKLLTLTLLILVGAFLSPAWGDKYEKITSSSDLEVGAEYLLVSGTTAYSGINSSNIGQGVTVTKDANGDITDKKTAHVLTLGGSSDSWTFYDEMDKKYIAYTNTATSKFNFLYQVSNNTDNGATWTLSVSSSAVTIKNNYNTGRWIRYNSDRFCCYYKSGSESTTGTAVTLYKKNTAASITPPTIKPDNGSTFTGTQSVTITQAESKDIYYTIDGTTPTSSSTLYSTAFSVVASTVTGEVTVKAIAIDGVNSSAVSSVTYTDTSIQPTSVSFTTNYAFLGVDDKGNISSKFTKTVKGVGITIDKTSGTWARGDNTYIRIYANNFFKVDAPSGYHVKQVVFTSPGTWGAEPTVGGVAISSKTWTGEAESVQFDFSATNYISAIEITLARALPLVVSFGDLNKTALVKGESGTFSTTVTPYVGSLVAGDDYEVTWASDKVGLTVTAATGAFVANTRGAYKVTATATALDDETYRDATKEYNVTVTEPVVITASDVAVATGGDAVAIGATTSDGYAGTLTYESADEDVATVDASGNVTAVAAGNTTITISATADAGHFYTAGDDVIINVTVTAPIEVTGVKLNKTSTTLLLGGTETLEATVSPNNATNKKVTWSSSDNTTVSVDENGVITALALTNGTPVVITVTTEDGNFKAECAVTVNPIAVTGVSLKSSTTIEKNKTETLTPTFNPENATDKTVLWESDNTDVATVSTEGVVTGVAAGTANITVTTNDGGYTASCVVTVVNKKGSADAPYSVAEIEAQADATTFGNDIYVTGYIVGSIKDNKCYKTTTTNLVNTNLLLADEPNISFTEGASINSNTDGLIPIELPNNGTIRSDWRIDTNNYLIGYKIILKGNAQSYFSTKGIKGTSEITAVSAPAVVSTSSYATFAANADLDFTKSNIKAYIAKAKDDGTGVTFDRVYKIPAGTGVLLYKDGGAEEAIPVTTESTEDVTNNVFVRGEGVAVASVVGNMYNYILNKVDNVVGFYKAAGQKVAKNRAYIQVESASFAKDFISMPGFDDSTTGVNEVNGSGLMVNGPVYDLQGRRVEKPGKGLYIVNGKKVLKY